LKSHIPSSPSNRGQAGNVIPTASNEEISSRRIIIVIRFLHEVEGLAAPAILSLGKV
jgi:hypothetical protein